MFRARRKEDAEAEVMSLTDFGQIPEVMSRPLSLYVSGNHATT
jgi:hypothetical protein